MKIRFLTIALIAMFAIVSVASAQTPQKSDGFRGKRMEMKQGQKHNKMCFDKFFTEEQKEQIKAIRLKNRKQLKPLRDEVRELEAHQQTLVTADTPDMKAIYQNIDKISTAKNKIQKIRAKQHQEIRALLTEEQRMKFDEMKERPMMKGRKNENFGKHCGAPDGEPGFGGEKEE